MTKIEIQGAKRIPVADTTNELTALLTAALVPALRPRKKLTTHDIGTAIKAIPGIPAKGVTTTISAAIPKHAIVDIAATKTAVRDDFHGRRFTAIDGCEIVVVMIDLASSLTG